MDISQKVIEPEKGTAFIIHFGPDEDSLCLGEIGEIIEGVMAIRRAKAKLEGIIDKQFHDTT